MFESCVEIYKASVVFMFLIYTFHLFRKMDKKISHVSMWFAILCPIFNSLMSLYVLYKIMMMLDNEARTEKKRRKER